MYVSFVADMFEVGSGKRSEGPSPSARQLHHPAEEGEEGEEEEGLGFFASADSDSEGEVFHKSVHVWFTLEGIFHKVVKTLMMGHQ